MDQLQTAMQRGFANAVKAASEKKGTDMETKINKPKQVYQAVRATPGQTRAFYAKATSLPESSAGKILVKLEAAGLLRRLVKGNTAYWSVEAEWDETAYDEAHKAKEAEWHRGNKAKVVAKEPEPDPEKESQRAFDPSKVSLAEAYALWQDLSKIFK